MKKKYLGIAGVLLFSLIMLVKQYSQYYDFKSTATMYSSLEYFDQQNSMPNKDYLVIGDGSIFTGISPRVLGENSFSHAMSANSLMDTFYLLKRIDLNQINKGIILSNSFFYEKHYEADFWNVIVPVKYYNFDELNDLYKTSKANKIFPATKYNEYLFWFKIIQNRYLFNSEFWEILKTFDGNLDLSTTYKRKIDQRLIKFNGYTYLTESQKPTRFFYAYRLHFNKFFYSNPTDDFYLKKILELLKNKKVYFVKTPLAKMAHSGIDVAKYETGLENYMKSLMHEYNNLEYLNLDSDLMKEDFYNFYNLNIEGSKKFSRNLKRRLLK